MWKIRANQHVISSHIKAITRRHHGKRMQKTLHRVDHHGISDATAGTGALDYTVFLNEASKLRDIPLMLEHLEEQEDYKQAADYIREIGRRTGISFA